MWFRLFGAKLQIYFDMCKNYAKKIHFVTLYSTKHKSRDCSRLLCLGYLLQALCANLQRSDLQCNDLQGYARSNGVLIARNDLVHRRGHRLSAYRVRRR